MKLGDKIGITLVFATIIGIGLLKAYMSYEAWTECRAAFHGLLYCAFR